MTEVRNMYGNEVAMQELQNDETRSKMRLGLKLYGFDLTLNDLEKLLTVEETPLFFDNNKAGYSREEILLTACKKIISNQRGTLKLVIWKNGKFSIFNKDAKPESFPRVPINYSYRGNDIWEKIRENLYVVFTKRYWQEGKVIGSLTDCTTRAQVEEWLNVYTRCLKKLEDNSTFHEIETVNNINNTGVLTLSELKDWEARIDATITKIQQLEKEEIQKRDNALKTRISITDNKVTIKALDDHTYTIETPNKAWTPQDWISVVYRHRYNWNPREEASIKEETLFSAVFHQLATTPLDWFKLSVDNKPEVKITLKKITNKKNQEVTIAYLNDRRVAYDEMYKAIRDYFISGQTLVNPAEEPEDEDEAEKQKALQVKKQRDETLINTGITGYITDLEGETPITIGFEKIGNNWYLVIGEKKLHLKGGIEMIKSLERVLKGTAQGYHARHSTEEFYTRLCKVLTPEEAIEVINTAKELGKLLNAIDKH